jgi:hypothetical protein
MDAARFVVWISSHILAVHNRATGNLCGIHNLGYLYHRMLGNPATQDGVELVVRYQPDSAAERAAASRPTRWNFRLSHD